MGRELIFKGLCGSVVILFGLLLLAVPASAQTPVPAATSAPPVEPTVQALQATIVAQGQDIRLVKQQLDQREAELKLLRDQINFDINWKFAVPTATVLITGVILGFLGLKGYQDLKNLYEKEMQRTLEKNLYRLDPTFLTIYIPDNNFDKEIERIKISGLKDVKTYPRLGDGTCQGVVIVSVRNPEEEERFREFLRTYKPMPEQAAYILYTPGQAHKISPETFAMYLNVTAATNPTALARAILDVGRGLNPKI